MNSTNDREWLCVIGESKEKGINKHIFLVLINIKKNQDQMISGEEPNVIFLPQIR